MDFQEMRRRLNRDRYKQISDLRNDFLLMMKNCDTFNKNNNYFYKYGKRIRHIGIIVFKSAEQEAARTKEVRGFNQVFYGNMKYSLAVFNTSDCEI